MCGRARCTLDPKFYQKCAESKMKQDSIEWKIGKDQFKPSYNIAPKCFLPVVTYNQKKGKFEIETKSWGFEGKKLFNINCRFETWRGKFGWKRIGLLLINGFYEWNEKKETYYIHPKSSREDIFFVGVLYDSTSFSILTTSPISDEYKKLHHRIPLLVGNPSEFLRGESVVVEESVSFYRVSNFVNKIGNDSAKCIKPFQSPLKKFFSPKKKKTKKKKMESDVSEISEISGSKRKRDEEELDESEPPPKKTKV